MSKRTRSLNEFSTVQINFTDEEFALVACLVSEYDDPLVDSIVKKCNKAKRFFVARNNAIKQRKDALSKNASQKGES